MLNSLFSCGVDGTVTAFTEENHRQSFQSVDRSLSEQAPWKAQLASRGKASLSFDSREAPRSNKNLETSGVALLAVSFRMPLKVSKSCY
jgi:hypothetical protein